jgi:hypothetical protein
MDYCLKGIKEGFELVTRKVALRIRLEELDDI